MAGKGKVFLGLVFLVLILGAGEVRAEERETEDMDLAIQDIGIEKELEEMQFFLDSIMGQEESGPSFSFRQLMKGLAAGDLKGILGQAGKGISRLLFSEMHQGGKLLAQVAAIGFTGAVFSNISSVLKNGQTADTGFFVTYLLLFASLVGSFSASLQVAGKVLGQILEFMKLLMPAFFLSAAFSGGSISALALYEAMMAAAYLVQWLCSGILLSVVKIYVLLVLGSHVVKEPFLDRLTELAQQTVEWSLKTLLGLVLGYQVIQSVILPYADAAGRTGFKRLLEIIPGLGQGAGAVAQIVLGSGVLIKNSMGAAAMVVLVLLALVPVAKLTVLMILYQCAAAVMQPVCDGRMVSCVSGMAGGNRLLLRIVLYSLFLFLVALAITCAATNVNYFAA